MPDPDFIKPDRDFLHRILDEGGEDLKKCFQCATCSVVCELSTTRKPFPRKEMIWAQWGLKDRLVADPDIWLCHQCNDCSTRCPRGARPGDVLSALRRQSVLHYAVPGFLANWVSRGKYLPLMFLVPVVLMALALAMRGPVESIGPLKGILAFINHPGFYADFFPHWLLIGFFSFFTGLALAAAAAGAGRFWRAMKAADESAGGYTPVVGILRSIGGTLASVLSHDKFRQCDSRDSRGPTHLLAFYGFMALLAVTVWALIDIYFNPNVLGIDPYYPFGLMHPMKILANVGCVVLIVGCLKAIKDRASSSAEAGASTSFDWIFVGLLLSVGLSGLLTEILRFAAESGEHATEGAGITGLVRTAYAVYFVHLVFVFELLVYLPYSKFAHVVYRTVALVYAVHTGRNQGNTEEAVPIGRKAG